MKKQINSQFSILNLKKTPILFIIFVSIITSLLFYRQNSLIKNRHQSNKVKGNAVAYFAGGCFWSSESALEKLDGVTDAVSGYMGGDEINPSYEDVSSGKTGHRETIKVIYDNKKVSYDKLTEYFLKHIDPTDPEGSFYDRGFHYTSAIYYSTTDEKDTAIRIIKKLDSTKKLSKPIVTKIEPAKVFYSAEEYHQDYAKNNAVQYGIYRGASGRDEFFSKTWGNTH